jgi:signal transduction histidine kinase
VAADGLGRYPREVEAAVYFCCLEALQNATKHSEASGVVVRLSAEDGELRFEVEDDGVGFDPRRTGQGTGLQGMTDRIDAIGGRLEIRSAPGEGSMVSGVVPLQGGSP